MDVRRGDVLSDHVVVDSRRHLSGIARGSRIARAPCERASRAKSLAPFLTRSGRCLCDNGELCARTISWDCFIRRRRRHGGPTCRAKCGNKRRCCWRDCCAFIGEVFVCTSPRKRCAMSEKIHSHHLARKAMLYVRQSSSFQVAHNQESQKLQYAMRVQAHSVAGRVPRRRRAAWIPFRCAVAKSAVAVPLLTASSRQRRPRSSISA